MAFLQFFGKFYIGAILAKFICQKKKNNVEKTKDSLVQLYLKTHFKYRLISDTQYTTTTTHNYVYTTTTHFIFRLHILLNMYSFTNNQEVWERRNASNTSSSILKNVSNILGYLEFPCLDEIATAFFCVDTFSVSLAFLGIIMTIFFSILHTIE